MKPNSQKGNFKNFLEQKYHRQISDSELFEYKDRLSKFIEILIEIDQKQKKKGKTNDN